MEIVDVLFVIKLVVSLSHLRCVESNGSNASMPTLERAMDGSGTLTSYTIATFFFLVFFPDLLAKLLIAEQRIRFIVPSSLSSSGCETLTNVKVDSGDSAMSTQRVGKCRCSTGLCSHCAVTCPGIAQPYRVKHDKCSTCLAKLHVALSTH
jgi:hypothetical protein